jgi:hypothetical protein
MFGKLHSLCWLVYSTFSFQLRRKISRPARRRSIDKEESRDGTRTNRREKREERRQHSMVLRPFRSKTRCTRRSQVQTFLLVVGALVFLCAARPLLTLLKGDEAHNSSSSPAAGATRDRADRECESRNRDIKPESRRESKITADREEDTRDGGGSQAVFTKKQSNN